MYLLGNIRFVLHFYNDNNKWCVESLLQECWSNEFQFETIEMVKKQSMSKLEYLSECLSNNNIEDTLTDIVKPDHDQFVEFICEYWIEHGVSNYDGEYWENDDIRNVKWQEIKERSIKYLIDPNECVQIESFKEE